MGLRVSHGCWDSSYSSFNLWRCALAEAAGLPPLMLMEGFYELMMLKEKRTEPVYPGLPIKWSAVRPDALTYLLSHPDDCGKLYWDQLPALADRLEDLLPKLEKGYNEFDWSPRELAKIFIEGLRKAYAEEEDVTFR